MSQIFNLRKVLIALVFAVLGFGATAKADVVYLGPVASQGNGIGAVTTILTIQHDGFEQGCVRRAAGADVTCSQDEKTGAGQTLTRTLAELGVSNATDLRVIFNLNETGNAADISRFVTLQKLEITVWNGDTLLTTFVCSNCADANHLTLNQADGGIGGSGHAFGLDAAQAATLQGFINTFGTGLRIGIAGAAGCATAETADCRQTDDGPDTFAGASAVAVPEPASMFLLGSGLVGAAAGIRRRRRNAKQ